MVALAVRPATTDSERGQSRLSRSERVIEVRLTREERMILALLADGYLLDGIARRMCTSNRTLRRRIRGVCDRLGVQTPIQAVAWAARRGLI
ncbi:helix-turn-helix domain-containing protein [Actinoalloteichus hymeniacidonis]|uniref:Transcriptional regulator, luxR family n=1 Tax=Actinoalloteichus hymeniacidonis TaxID=340345 RepID=A0AAC9N0C4_9PSEU|nr:LuxR C-terminal-related transcriptional regulator [Actinoalloteichus hymeniacidonis]AOS64937.1 transcriptional regulator, luxR family [Actinoalloteichus hymeniacidonis]MBB5906988.1 DNA-binding NarL/FixJ family response regulator [Actinoalloteichus hymeniacidonis]